MSVLSVNETWNGRQADDTNTITTYTRSFRVITDDPLDGALTVILQSVALGLPDVLEVFIDANGEEDTTAKCYRRVPHHDQDDPYVWIVTCEYTNDQYIDPLNSPAMVAWDVEKYQRVIYQAYDGLGLLTIPIVNGAGEMFDPPVTKDDTRLILTYTRNEEVCKSPHLLSLLYQDTVNNAPFLGWPAITVKCDSIKGRFIRNGKVEYWENTYQFHFRKETWATILLNMGYREKLGSGTLVNILDPTGHPTSNPWPLNTAGEAYDGAFDGPLLAFINANLLTFNVYRKVDLSVLNIDLPECVP